MRVFAGPNGSGKSSLKSLISASHLGVYINADEIVLAGGHDVPEDKIVSRYERSLNLLYDAIRHSSRAYIFDNSTDDETMSWVAEFTGGNECMYKTEVVPAWFTESVVRKANSS